MVTCSFSPSGKGKSGAEVITFHMKFYHLYRAYFTGFLSLYCLSVNRIAASSGTEQTVFHLHSLLSPRNFIPFCLESAFQRSLCVPLRKEIPPLAQAVTQPQHKIPFSINKSSKMGKSWLKPQSYGRSKHPTIFLVLELFSLFIQAQLFHRKSFTLNEDVGVSSTQQCL